MRERPMPHLLTSAQCSKAFVRKTSQTVAVFSGLDVTRGGSIFSLTFPGLTLTRHGNGVWKPPLTRRVACKHFSFPATISSPQNWPPHVHKTWLMLTRSAALPRANSQTRRKGLLSRTRDLARECDGRGFLCVLSGRLSVFCQRPQRRSFTLPIVESPASSKLVSLRKDFPLGDVVTVRSRAPQLAHSTRQKVSFRHVLTGDLDFAFVFSGLCEIVSHLHSQPRLRRAAKRLA